VHNNFNYRPLMLIYHNVQFKIRGGISYFVDGCENISQKTLNWFVTLQSVIANHKYKISVSQARNKRMAVKTYFVYTIRAYF
jgi:hypothetical protein